MLENQPADCVHTSITRESVMISSTQVLFAEKCTDMNVEKEIKATVTPEIFSHVHDVSISLTKLTVIT